MRSAACGIGGDLQLGKLRTVLCSVGALGAASGPWGGGLPWCQLEGRGGVGAVRGTLGGFQRRERQTHPDKSGRNACTRILHGPSTPGTRCGTASLTNMSRLGWDLRDLRFSFEIFIAAFPINVGGPARRSKFGIGKDSTAGIGIGYEAFERRV